MKTAETLKYGKYIIGTKESLEGYDVTPEIATVCNTAAAFIEAIGSYQRPFKFNPPSRQLFRQKYSYDAVISSYANLLNVPTPQSL